jgi:hypothetical protein
MSDLSKTDVCETSEKGWGDVCGDGGWRRTSWRYDQSKQPGRGVYMPYVMHAAGLPIMPSNGWRAAFGDAFEAASTSIL